MNEIRSEILKHLEKNSKADLGELAILLGTDEISVANEIADMEKEGIICGYHTLIDWDKAGRGPYCELSGSNCSLPDFRIL